MHPKVSKELSFAGQSFYIGIDVHKKSWKVSIYGEHYEHRTYSQHPSAEELASYLKRHFPGGTYYAVYESGFSGFTACRCLRQLGVNCQVVHAADVPASQKEKLQKTDAIDSRRLARMLRGKELEAIHIPEVELEADRSLVRLRQRLVKDICRTKNRVKSLLFQFGIGLPDRLTAAQSRYWSRAYLNWLQNLAIPEAALSQTLESYIRVGKQLRAELLKVNKAIRELAGKARYQQDVELLIGIPGIGLISAMLILTQLADIKRFKTEDALCQYVGLVPKMEGSGEKIKVGKMLNRGRKELKIVLIEVAWIAVRKDPALMSKFNELARQMHQNKAIIRIARKILNRIRYVLRTQKAYVTGTVK